MALTEKKLAKIGTALETGEMPGSLTPDQDTASITAVILKEAGVTMELVAQRLFEGLSAEKTVVLEETYMVGGEPMMNMKGDFVTKKTAYNMVDFEQRRRYAGVVMELITPKSERGQTIGTMNIIVPQVPAEMLQLRGEMAQKYYVDRTRALALGHEPPPIENYLNEKKEELDGGTQSGSGPIDADMARRGED